MLKSPRSNFYRVKYASAGFEFNRDLRITEDIVRIPRLTREELTAVSPLKRLYLPFDKIDFLRHTSGTTGTKPLLLFRNKMPGYALAGERCLILRGDIGGAYVMTFYRKKRQPPPLVIVATSQNMTLLQALMDDFQPDSLETSPTLAILTADHINMITRERIKFVQLLGERYGTTEYEILRTQYPNADIAVSYGSAELGIPSYQCKTLKAMKPFAYHPHPLCFLEITDPSNGAWIPDKEEGELVVTELYESPHQIIRYRTGDAGRIVNSEKCACNAPFAFEGAGRIKHDIIKIAGGVIRTDEIERVIAGLSRQFEPDFRGVVEFVMDVDGKSLPAFSLSLIPKDKLAYHPAAIEKIRQEIAGRLFLTTTKTLADFLKEGQFASFDIIFVEMFSPEAKAQRLRFKERGANSPQ